MKQQKKCLGNSNERADQIASRNEDKTLGILKANLMAFSELVILAVDRTTTVT